MVRDTLKEIAPLIGVILTFVSGYFVYRQTERQREREIKQAQQMPAIVQASAFASDHAPRLIADAITEGHKCVCEAIADLTKYLQARDEKEDRAMEAALTDLREISRSMTSIARIAEHAREDHRLPR